METLQKIFLSRTGGRIYTKLGMYDRGLQSIIVCSNDDHGVTLTYFDLFYSKVKFSYLGFSMGNVKIVDFSEIISPIDLKEGRFRHLIEFMKVF